MSVRFWQERLYKVPLSRDPVSRFYRTLDGYVRTSLWVLDVGAGPGEENPYALRDRVRKLIGIDRDPRVESNPLLYAGLIADGGSLPFKDDSFDVAFSIYVLENIVAPRALASELRRILRPVRLFLALTPSRFHYVSLIASFTPTRFHRWINNRRARKDQDTSPIHYRLKSRRQLQTHFRDKGFGIVEFDQFEVQPNYLLFSTPTYLLGALYERIANACDWLASLRVNFTRILGNTKSGQVASGCSC